MRETLTIEKINFNIRTQALLNFTPISFVFKHKSPRGEVEQKPFWSEEAHRSLGKNVITCVDKDNLLWEIKIMNFPKEYDKLIQIMEISPYIIPQNFNLIEGGLVGVNFHSVLTWVNAKYIVPRKMQERNSYSG